MLLRKQYATGCVVLQFHTDGSAAVFFVKSRRSAIALQKTSGRLTLPDSSKVVETLVAFLGRLLRVDLITLEGCLISMKFGVYIDVDE